MQLELGSKLVADETQEKNKKMFNKHISLHTKQIGYIVTQQINWCWKNLFMEKSLHYVTIRKNSKMKIKIKD